ncbi:MAG: hypothetical protein Kow0090_12210 [Myxococcota bacterium]
MREVISQTGKGGGMVRNLLLAIAVLLFVGLYLRQDAYADCTPEHKSEKGSAGEAEASPIKATVEGENFCIGCALKMKSGAKAQCSLFGHRHALKVTKATDEKGKELKNLKGVTLHYLDNEKSQDLIKKQHGKTVKVKGVVYPDENVLEVESEG